MKRMLVTMIAFAIVVPAIAIAAKPKPGTRENPIAMGKPSAIGGGWILTVFKTIPNANQIVADENQFNDPPRPGRQFFMIRIRATWRGSGEEAYDAGFRLRAVGKRTNASYKTFGDASSCGVIPQEYEDDELFPGGSQIGWICFSVAKGDVPTLVLYDSGDLFDDPIEKKFFALHK